MKRKKITRRTWFNDNRIWQKVDDLGAVHPKRNSAFCLFYAPTPTPYITYHEVPKKNRGQNIPLVLMMMRWDGYIGFPGGSVDKGETILEAMVRELSEEINCPKVFLKEDKFKPLITLTDHHGTGHVHSFSQEVTQDDLMALVRESTLGPQFFAETQGLFAVQIANFHHNGKLKGGIGAFVNNNFKATSLIELQTLIEREQWLLSVDVDR